jgi:tellurite resistance protein
MGYDGILMDLKGIQTHADAIKKDLAVPKQNEVFEAAAEAGFLAASADGNVDDEEHQMLVQAIDVLSTGAVIEWEVESLLEGCATRLKADGDAKRAEAVGTKLKALGQPEAGLLFAAFVAEASGGIDKQESAVLHAIGKAAGITKPKVTALLKKVGAKES